MLIKRAATVVMHWDGPVGWIENYATRTRMQITPPVIQVLDALSQWSTVRDVQQACSALDAATIAGALSSLTTARLIVSPADNEPEAAFDTWKAWCPAASYFHQATKDVRYVDSEVVASRAKYRSVVNPPPGRVSIPAEITLPPPAPIGQLGEVLRERRTWREFGSDAIRASELSTLLGSTWGTVGYLALADGLKLRLKTSPSGGACQSIEVYVAVRRVEGLDSGLYGYNADQHGLTRIGAAPDDREIVTWIGGQSWVADSAAVCFMTSVFERVQWKYRSPRAYRVIMLEAGHLCQTFCLVATALKLAPFCSAALADTTIERALGIDGVRESVLYAAGIGTRPPEGMA